MADPLQLVGEVVDRSRGKNREEFLADLAEFLKDTSRVRQPVVIVPQQVVVPPQKAQPIRDLRVWMQGVYDDPAFGLPVKVDVPAAPALTKQQKRAFRKFRIRLIFIPAITEDQFPASFVKPNRGKYLTASQVERRSLPGRWVAVETIAKPNYDDPNGYPNDALGEAVGLETRFKVSYDDLHTGGLLARMAAEAHLPKKETRLPTVEESNWIANLMNWLRTNQQEDLPDFGSTNSWEWTTNACESAYRCIVGRHENGGLDAVHGSWHGSRRDHIAFRVLTVL